MLSFDFNGKNSFRDYGIYITKRPRIDSPKRRVTYIDIPGRNSMLRYDENTYEDITVLVECTVLSRENLIENIDEIVGWLLGCGESDLVFSFQKNKKYIAQVVNSIGFQQVFKCVSKFPIVFNCRPFKYALNNEEISIESEELVINNPGTVYSNPIIKIAGNGYISLKVNGQEVEINDLVGEIIINSEIQDAYSTSHKNLNSNMKGQFPKLDVGENRIITKGNISSFKIIPNWRWL